MGLDLSSLTSNTAECTVDVLGETAHITYRPAAITTARIEAVDKRPDPGDPTPFIAFFVDVLEDWDIMKDKRKVPITHDSLGALPLFLLRLIFTAVMDDVSSGEAGKASSGTSPRTANSGRSRTGGRSSKRPATSA